MPNILTSAAKHDFIADYGRRLERADLIPAVRQNMLDVLHDMAYRMREQELIEAHEQALMENERRWADALDIEPGWNPADAKAIRELAVRVIRNWRLSKSAPLLSRYSRLCSLAAKELAEEYGLEVRGQNGGGWILADYTD